MAEAGERLHRNDDESWRRAQLVRIRQDQHVRIAARDLLDVDDVVETGRALTGLCEALLEAALEVVDPAMPFSIVGMGRLGGAEMSYASDLDLLLVYDGAGDAEGRGRRRVTAAPDARTESRPAGGDHRPRAATRRRPRTAGPRPARVRRLLRSLGRDLGAPGADAGPHRRRRPPTWANGSWPSCTNSCGTDPSPKRRGRHQKDEGSHRTRADPGPRGPPIPPEVGTRLAVRHRVDGAAAAASTSRPGDQHRRRARGPRASEVLGPGDLAALRDAYRFCERTRNRWHLVGALPGGASPGTPSRPRRTSSRAWPGVSAPHPRRCATTTAESPGGPAGWSSAASTGSRRPDRAPAAPVSRGGTDSIRSVQPREQA